MGNLPCGIYQYTEADSLEANIAASQALFTILWFVLLVPAIGTILSSNPRNSDTNTRFLLIVFLVLLTLYLGFFLGLAAETTPHCTALAHLDYPLFAICAFYYLLLFCVTLCIYCCFVIIEPSIPEATNERTPLLHVRVHFKDEDKHKSESGEQKNERDDIVDRHVSL